MNVGEKKVELENPNSRKKRNSQHPLKQMFSINILLIVANET